MNNKFASMTERERAYKNFVSDPAASMSAAPTKAEMESINARDPREFFQMMKKKEMEGMKSDTTKLKDGGMAGGKRSSHMYVGGGAVVDNLPNPGLKALAKSPKGRQAVRKMGFDV